MSDEDIVILEKVAFEFARRISGLDTVNYVFLFGSVVKRDVDRRSDADIFVVLDTDKKPETAKEYFIVSDCAIDVGKEYNKSIQLIITNKNFEGLDDFFVERVFVEGKILYAKNIQLVVEKNRFEPYHIVTYSLEKLSQGAKMKFKRGIFGRVSKRIYKGKEYVSKAQGFIYYVGGRALGKGCVLIPAKAMPALEKLFAKFDVEKYNTIPLWISSYNIPKWQRTKV
jgi:predicted nucleotidyltransferase